MNMFEEKFNSLFDKGNKQARVITLNNFKGGVGKTTLNSIITYVATEVYGLRVLQIDSDPQKNLTRKLYATYKEAKEEAKESITQAINKFDFKDSITKITDNLSIIEGSWELAKLEQYILTNITTKNNAQYRLYQSMIEPLRSEYDLILFDGIPTTSIITSNCIIASDYVIVPTQADDDAYENTVTYMNYLFSMADYNPKLEIIGIVPYLVTNDTTDIGILEKYRSDFPETTYQNIIKRSAKVKTWSGSGITRNKPYDKVTLKMYDKVFRETIERIYAIENDTELELE